MGKYNLREKWDGNGNYKRKMPNEDNTGQVLQYDEIFGPFRTVRLKRSKLSNKYSVC